MFDNVKVGDWVDGYYSDNGLSYPGRVVVIDDKRKHPTLRIKFNADWIGFKTFFRENGKDAKGGEMVIKPDKGE